MKILFSWLKEFIPLKETPFEIAKILTMLGMEVEAIETLSPSFAKVVVAEITHVEKHPNADQLRIATVDDGSQVVQVVCGAPNCRAGIKTAFAPIGAVVHDTEGQEMKIRKAKIRGVESNGMLCTGKELKISDDHSGILEFSDALSKGTSLADFYSEAVFEVGLTPNLGHCASIMGIVRELSAGLNLPFQKPDCIVAEDPDISIHRLAKVDVQDAQACPRYACRLIQGVKVGPSPEWLQKRLLSCGFRSVNNVVDATNYVLMEMGQPLHAFDFDLIQGHQILIRKASPHESLACLDEKERPLGPEMLVIADAHRPIALAGVMGGADTEVTDRTVNVLLESAYFHPRGIRKTSKQLGLQTEASKRFERGTDPNHVIQALDRAAALIQQLGSGRVCSGMIDIKREEFRDKYISCRASRVKHVLGAPLSINEIENVFHRLGFSSTLLDADTFNVKIPTYRADLQTEIDLIEEVGRIFGYENIQKLAVKFESSSLPHAPIFLFEREMRARLLSEGLQEFLTCDLIGPKQAAIIENGAIAMGTLVKVMNPTSIEQSILRPSLLPGLLQVVKDNIAFQNWDISGFEVGKIHFKKEEQFKEQSVAGIILSGKNTPQYWKEKPIEVDFFFLKGMVENVLSEWGITEITFVPSRLGPFHTGRQASIHVGSLMVGVLGEVHPGIVREWDISQKIYYAELNLHDLIQLRKQNIKMTPLAAFPGSERDWTLTLRVETPIQVVLDAIRSIPSLLLQEVGLLDMYQSERLGKERKNATLHFVYRDLQKTVSQEEVDAEHARLTQGALEKLGKSIV